MQEAPSTPQFTLQDSKKYYQELLKKLPKTKERVVIAAMIFLWGKKTEPLFAQIEQALNRGVRVHILLDNYTRLAVVNNSKLAYSEWRIRLKKTLLELEKFRTRGARISYVGKIGINPYKGRCHIKVTILDDDCYSFGGINISDEHLTNHDYMLHTRDQDVADCLDQLVGHIAQAPSFLPDAEVAFGKETTVLFDGGEPRNSIIYSRAIELANESRRVYFVSQYAPSGALAQALQKIETSFYFNRPEQMAAPSRWGQAFDQSRYRTPNGYTQATYIHAKFVLFELKNGKKALLSGSNNFSYRGVAFGTKELALYSTDESLWQQLRKFVDTHISQQ